MLSICDTTPHCRREFLRVGGLSLGGWTLPALWNTPRAAAASGSVTTGKSVVFVFMHGGPSQFETFDPKLTAPPRNRQRHGRGRDSPARCHFWRVISPAGTTGRPTDDRAFLPDRRRSTRCEAGRFCGHCRCEPRVCLCPSRGHESSSDRHADQHRIVSPGGR